MFEKKRRSGLSRWSQWERGRALDTDGVKGRVPALQSGQ